jgi:hypothetical protein
MHVSVKLSHININSMDARKKGLLRKKSLRIYTDKSNKRI